MVTSARPLLRKLLPLLLLLATACSPLPQGEHRRFFWPPTPNEPKIEYINFYLADEDLKRGVDNRLAEAIFGKDPPKELFIQPYSVASNGQGRIYVSDFSDSRVHVLDFAAHSYRLLSSNGGLPMKLVCDEQGDLWVLYSNSKQIGRFSADEEWLTTLDIKFASRPTSLAVDRARERLYVVDAPAHLIRILDFSGVEVGTIGKRGNGVGEFNFPTDLALDRSGQLYVLDTLNARVQVLSPEGKFIRAFGERGDAAGSFSIPKGIAVSPAGLVYVTDAGQQKFVVFDAQGEFLLTIGGRQVFTGTYVNPGGFYLPVGIAVDRHETIWVVDLMNRMVHEFQYLTPDYLARRPINTADIYVPDPVVNEPRPPSPDAATEEQSPVIERLPRP